MEITEVFLGFSVHYVDLVDWKNNAQIKIC